jgi:hypothetical protein
MKLSLKIYVQSVGNTIFSSFVTEHQYFVTLSVDSVWSILSTYRGYFYRKSSRLLFPLSKKQAILVEFRIGLQKTCPSTNNFATFEFNN